MHLMTTFQQLEPNLLMRYPLLLTVQVMPIALLAATTSSFSVQLVLVMYFLSEINYLNPKQQVSITFQANLFGNLRILSRSLYVIFNFSTSL